MDSYLKYEINRARIVCNQALLPGGTLTICLVSSYDNITQKLTIYKYISTFHWWAGVE